MILTTHRVLIDPASLLTRNRLGVSYIVLLGAILCGCRPSTYEVREANDPISFSSAEEQAGIKLPVPPTATRVQFRLSGSTQDWQLFVRFAAPAADVERTVNEELKFWKSQAVRPVNLRMNASDDWGLTKRLVNGNAPIWWRPKNCKFSGSTGKDLDVPQFWVSNDQNEVWVYHEF